MSCGNRPRSMRKSSYSSGRPLPHAIAVSTVGPVFSNAFIIYSECVSQPVLYFYLVQHLFLVTFLNKYLLARPILSRQRAFIHLRKFKVCKIARAIEEISCKGRPTWSLEDVVV